MTLEWVSLIAVCAVWVIFPAGMAWSCMKQDEEWRGDGHAHGRAEHDKAESYRHVA